MPLRTLCLRPDPLELVKVVHHMLRHPVTLPVRAASSSGYHLRPHSRVRGRPSPRPMLRSATSVLRRRPAPHAPRPTGPGSGFPMAMSYLQGRWLVYVLSWLHTRPVSLRPSGARSSHGYMPQMASVPRARMPSRCGNDAILQRERAYAGPFSPVGRPVRSGARRPVVEPGTVLSGRGPQVHRAVVILDGSRLPLLLGICHPEVVVEVAAERRRPGETPAHPLLVRLQFRQRSPRYHAERDVVMGEVNDGAVKAVRDRRAARAPGRVSQART